MSEWKEYILKDVIEKFIDYRGKTPPKVPVGVPLVTAKVVKNGRIEEPNEFISEDTYTQWMTRGYPKKNDIILTTEAPLGEIALLKIEKVALAQRVILLRGKPSICHNVFLKYFLQSKDGQATLLVRASGSTVEGIKAAELKEITIPLPPLPEQRAIASVLGSLDDKIDLLHRQNKTLEALAETLFREWFVEKAEENWEEAVLADIVSHYKATISPLQAPSQEFYHYSIPAYDGGRYPKIELGTDIKSNKYRVKSNSILISKLNPRFPRIWAIPADIQEEMSICSTEFQVLLPKNFLYYGFTFFYLKSMPAILELASAASGTSGSHQRVQPSDILNLRLSIPPENIIERYNNITSPFWEKINNNSRQIRTLTSLRDMLLPKLMSGEVRVRKGGKVRTGQKKKTRGNTQQELPFDEVLATT